MDDQKMPSPTVVQHELQDKDILCTQDKSLRNHAGNRFFREYVDRMLPAYKAAENKLEKMNITKTMVDALQDKHGHRFVRFDEETASWVEASALIAREKVGHALRNAMRSEHKKALKRLKPRTHQQLPLAATSASLTIQTVASIELPPMTQAKPIPMVSTDVTTIAEPAATTARPERKTRFSGLFRSLSQSMIDLIEHDTAIVEPLDAPSSDDVTGEDQSSAFKRPSFLSMFRSISQGLKSLIGQDSQEELQDHTQDDQQQHQQQQRTSLFRKKRFSGLASDMFRSFSGGYMAESTTASRRSTILSEQDLEPLGLTTDRSMSHGLATELLKWANNSDPAMAAPQPAPPMPTMMESTSSFSAREESNSSISVACESDFRALDPSETNQFMRSWLEGSQPEM